MRSGPVGASRRHGRRTAQGGVDRVEEQQRERRGDRNSSVDAAAVGGRGSGREHERRRGRRRRRPGCRCPWRPGGRGGAPRGARARCRRRNPRVRRGRRPKGSMGAARASPSTAPAPDDAPAVGAERPEAAPYESGAPRRGASSATVGSSGAVNRPASRGDARSCVQYGRQRGRKTRRHGRQERRWIQRGRCDRERPRCGCSGLDRRLDRVGDVRCSGRGLRRDRLHEISGVAGARHPHGDGDVARRAHGHARHVERRWRLGAGPVPVEDDRRRSGRRCGNRRHGLVRCAVPVPVPNEDLRSICGCRQRNTI